MNLTESVTITARGNGSIDQDTGLPSITPTVEFDNLRCSFTLLTAGEHAQNWGDSQPVDYSKTYAHLRLPAWVPDLPESGKRLADYSFAVHDYESAWNAEAVKHGAEFQTVLVSQKN